MDAQTPDPDTNPAKVEPRRRELLQRALHDLKNPLSVVRASLEWLEVEIADREEALDAVRDASAATRRLMVIVDDLEVLVQLDRGRRIGSDSIDISALLGRVCASAGARLGARGISLVSTAPAALTTTGDADLITRSVEAMVDACERGARSGASLELDARAVEERVVEGAVVDAHILIEVGLAGTAGTAAAPASLDAFASGGLGVFLAMRVAEAHGGTLVVVPTATLPRLILSLRR
jgi:signal transduction histidine kinase